MKKIRLIFRILFYSYSDQTPLISYEDAIKNN